MVGSVGDVQVFVRMLEVEVRYYQFMWGRFMIVKVMVYLFSNIFNENKWFLYMVQIIIGGYVEEFILVNFDLFGGFIFDDYIVIGLGSFFVIVVFEDGFRKDMSFEEVKELVVRVVRIVGKRDVYIGDRKVQVVVISKDGMKEEFVEFKE